MVELIGEAAQPIPSNTPRLPCRSDTSRCIVVAIQRHHTRSCEGPRQNLRLTSQAEPLERQQLTVVDLQTHQPHLGNPNGPNPPSWLMTLRHTNIITVGFDQQVDGHHEEYRRDLKRSSSRSPPTFSRQETDDDSALSASDPSQRTSKA